MADELATHGASQATGEETLLIAGPKAASASSGPPESPTAPVAPGTSDSEWPSHAADLIEQVVASVHDRAIRPLIIAARGIVFGLLIATMLLVLGVLGSVAAIRLLDVYVFGSRVWASYTVMGALFTGAGLMAWSRRQRSSQTT